MEQYLLYLLLLQYQVLQLLQYLLLILEFHHLYLQLQLDLLAQLGRANRHAVAEALLAWLSPHVALAQCAIFSFE